MAAQALYRKWRSQTFSEVVGQDHVITTLRNAILDDRIAHAYLFTGPRGVGKTSMARLLAKAVNCAAPKEQRPCGECHSCVAIAEGRAIDVIEMDAASHTSVDDARELIDRVQFRPTLGSYKVYVIDEVHMLSTAAFNALLKTLEEPPSHAIFILATTEIHKVPATILSRCQRFTFSRHSLSQIATHLHHIAEEEGYTITPDVAHAIARAATGSMRDALGILEQLSSFTNNHITLEQVQGLLGMTSAAEVNSLIDSLLNGDIPSAIQAISGIADQGSDIRQFTRDLVERLRSLMFLVVTNEPTLIDTTDDDRALLESWSSKAHPAMLVQWIKRFSSLDYQLRTSPYGHLPLELAVIECLVIPVASPSVAPEPPARPTPKRPKSSTRRSPPHSVPSEPTPAPAPPADPIPAPVSPAPPAPMHSGLPSDDSAMVVTPPPAPVSSPEPPPPSTDDVSAPPPSSSEAPPQQTRALPLPMPQSSSHGQQHRDAIRANMNTFEHIEQIWPDIVRDVRPRNRTLEAVLNSGVRPVDVEGTTVVLLAPYKFHQKRVEDLRNRRIIEEVISKHLGRTFTIRVTEVQPEKEDMTEQLRQARGDPRVRAAINVFDARIVGIEPHRSHTSDDDSS